MNSAKIEYFFGRTATKLNRPADYISSIFVGVTDQQKEGDRTNEQSIFSIVHAQKRNPPTFAQLTRTLIDPRYPTLVNRSWIKTGQILIIFGLWVENFVT